MKTKRFLIATLLVVVTTSVAVVSCKKATLNTLSNNTSQSVKTFAVPQVDNMNTYLKDFKQKMQAATRDEEETFTLEEAAWYLSSLANYEFANINVKCNAVRFDTLYAQVNITNGSVLLSDLGLAYEGISASIMNFNNSLALNNKHFRFINAFISENGEVTVPILTTYIQDSKGLPDHTWYYADDWTLIYACDSLLPEESYAIQTEGTPALQSALNLVVSHPLTTGIPEDAVLYFTYASSKQFDYNQYIDQYGSPFNNSRLFNSYNTTNVEVNSYDMCYLHDSYMGLGRQYRPANQVIATWEVIHDNVQINDYRSIEFHKLRVIYGTVQGTSPIPPDPNDD